MGRSDERVGRNLARESTCEVGAPRVRFALAGSRPRLCPLGRGPFFDHENRMFTLRFKSIEDDAIPVVPGFIRAEAYTTFLAIDGHTEQWIRLRWKSRYSRIERHIASWLVNLIQRTWPRNTIVGLYRRSIQGDVAAHPEAESW